MLYFSRFKTALIWTFCVLGVLLSAPNFVKPDVFSWLSAPRFHLGLDLRGGSYLLLQVDTETMVKERLETTLDATRNALRDAGIGYRDLAAGHHAITFTLVDPARENAAQDVLRPVMTGATPASRDFSFEATDGRVRMNLADQAVKQAESKALEQSVEIVRRRIDETGVNEPVVARQGTNRVLVEMPGIDDPGRIKRLLGQTAKMTFHLLGDETGTRTKPGIKMLPSSDRPGQSLPVRTKVELDGSHLRDASAGTDPRTGEWVVHFSFDSVGAKRFADITKANVGRPFAIVLDGKVVSAPVIREQIAGGQGQISGRFTARDANDLAVLLRAGALPAPLTVLEERTVGPDLGADAIHAGMVACLVGFVLVVGYMGLSYGLFGLFANVALFFNLGLTLAALSLLQATLTLPGVAGILLTLGLSVDANVLINERIREEERKGSTPLAAMEAGFRRAYATIVDSNLTTLIKMVILYAIGTGTVKGFAVTISLGIITSMFTATVLARWMMVTWYRWRKPKVLGIGTRFRLVPDGTRIPFMKGRNLGLLLSALISAASVGLFVYPGLNLGVDFAGGTVVEIRTAQPADFGALRTSLGGLGLGQVSLQQFGGSNDVLIRFERQAGGDEAQQAAVGKVQQTLAKEFSGASVRRVESVGATISAELFHDGMLALGLASIAMLIYITFRFEWAFGVGAVVTLLLDVTKTIGFFAVTGLQFNLTSIAAILTIMGYSISDKVVVYDRVRENLRCRREVPLRALIDLSINETLSRTTGTSLAIFLATLPLALFGGEALREFAWVLLFGVVLATSSSIFIAAPILLHLGEHRLRRSGSTPGSAHPNDQAGLSVRSEVADGVRK